jgi:5-methyltetrahydrofolate--homocysteine methyltransferase
VFQLTARLREELKVNTTVGASNISFGLPQRIGINAAFLTMAAASGLTSAITNPLEPEIRQAVMAANVLNGVDPDCVGWIKAYRQPSEDGERERRRTGRRNRQ